MNGCPENEPIDTKFRKFVQPHWIPQVLTSPDLSYLLVVGIEHLYVEGSHVLAVHVVPEGQAALNTRIQSTNSPQVCITTLEQAAVCSVSFRVHVISYK